MSDLHAGLGNTGTDYGASDPRPKRSVEFSQVENVYVIRYENINPTGRLFGGQLVSWIDEVAGACASRHTGLAVTTASIDNLTFKRGAYLADRLVLVGRITFVGRSSCEIRVDSFIEDKDGYRHIINRAFLTYVAIDEKGNPLPIMAWRSTPWLRRPAGTGPFCAAITANRGRTSDSDPLRQRRSCEEMSLIQDSFLHSFF